MKTAQYVIEFIDDQPHKYMQWNGSIVLFETQEDAEEMITDCSIIFTKPLALEIRRGIFIVDNSINYKQLKNGVAYKQLVNLSKEEK